VEGRLFPASFAGFVVGVLLCGWLSDRWGRKSVLLVAIAAYALGLLLTSIAPGFALACLAAALIGAGSGSIETVASALAADLYPERRALLLNSVQIAFGAGAAIGPYFAHRMLSHGTDWRALYVGLAAGQVALFAALAVQRVPARPGADETVDFAALVRLFREGPFLALCLAQALYVGAEVAFAAWMPTYFRNSLPGGIAWEGLVVTVFWVAMTVGRIAVAPLIGRIPLLRLTITLAVGGVAGSALATIWTQPLTVMACVAWTGLCFSGIFGLILAEAGARYPALSGSAFGGITASGGVGAALLPWAVALLAGTSLHWRGALLLVPAAIAALALVLTLAQRRQQPPTTSH
jgi:FHS family glucose/mannose:H+ symporter-like MFS transporter